MRSADRGPIGRKPRAWAIERHSWAFQGADRVFKPLEGGVSANIEAILERLNAICLNTLR